MTTPQIARWTEEFGRQYTDRNSLTLLDLDALYRKNYGMGRSALNREFLAHIPSDSSMLEVGCNSGNQLLLLREMGYSDLHGIEVQPYALERARSRLEGVDLAEASAFKIPYPDRRFDLVFTSGVLIHIAPEDLPKAADEIYRCTSKYIWGLEYYSPHLTEVNYRGHKALMWKMDYARFFLERFSDLEMVEEKFLPYLENSNMDCMYLLRKKS